MLYSSVVLHSKSELTGKNLRQSVLFLISSRLKSYNFMKKETPEQVFSWYLGEIFRKARNLWAAAAIYESS